MYIPAPALLKKYANVLINFALNSGNGIKPKEVVYIVTSQVGLPLAREIYKTVLESGGHPLLTVKDDECEKILYANASDEQLKFFPKAYMSGLAENIDHWVRVLGEEDPYYLKKSDPAKVMLAGKTARPFRDMLDAKENKGKFTWTLALYGTEKMADEAGLSIGDYWKQITNACFLNTKDPVAKWKETYSELYRVLGALNALDIDKIHLTAEGTDLHIKLGDKRRWLGGRGRNIPSFEIFTSPDWRGTEGKISFDLPLYRYGNIIKDISLEFKEGKVISAKASKNEALLKEMIKQENADKVGEFSLTDKRFSKINKFMANTLFDENFGGKWGNTHLAVGNSYLDTYVGNSSKLTKKQKADLGYNHSSVHTDIIASTNRKVLATTKKGKQLIIYQNGEFQI